MLYWFRLNPRNVTEGLFPTASQPVAPLTLTDREGQ
jgi:hypothetical protein